MPWQAMPPSLSMASMPIPANRREQCQSEQAWQAMPIQTLWQNANPSTPGNADPCITMVEHQSKHHSKHANPSRPWPTMQVRAHQGKRRHASNPRQSSLLQPAPKRQAGNHANPDTPWQAMPSENHLDKLADPGMPIQVPLSWQTCKSKLVIWKRARPTTPSTPAPIPASPLQTCKSKHPMDKHAVQAPPWQARQSKRTMASSVNPSSTMGMQFQTHPCDQGQPRHRDGKQCRSRHTVAICANPSITMGSCQSTFHLDRHANQARHGT